MPRALAWWTRTAATLGAELVAQTYVPVLTAATQPRSRSIMSVGVRGADRPPTTRPRRSTGSTTVDTDRRPTDGHPNHDPDQATRGRTGQHGPARTATQTARRHRSTIGARRSHNVEDRGTSWETIKAVTNVSAGCGLDSKRARRDSNPQPSDP